MKNEHKSHSKRGFGSTTDIVGVSLCLVWVLLTDNKVVNAMFGSEKPKVESKAKLDLPDITIPELGKKYLQSCR